MHRPAFKDFEALAKQGNCVPVYREFFGDFLTPVAALEKIRQDDHAFLLESVTGGEKIGRYSILGARPFAEFIVHGHSCRLVKDGQESTFESEDPLKDLEALLAEHRPVALPDLPPTQAGPLGGAVGYAGYDVIRYIENLPDAPTDTLHLPDMAFMLCDTVIIFDHVANTIRIVSLARLDGRSPKVAYDEARERIDATAALLRQPVAVSGEDLDLSGAQVPDYQSNFTPDDFIAAVLRCKEYIRAGDILQVVLSQRLHARTTADPFDIYRALRAINPSPYMYYLKLDDLYLVGSSPEVMVKVLDGVVNVRPIAGTRHRGATEEEDLALEKELLADPKERSEHIMLLDLGRNDVGRVARPKSVRIEERMIIERYSHVMHITSSVSGDLREDVTAFDALRACIPAGTVSGAPKIRAMEIIDELEPDRRGPYAGGVGYFDFYGNLNTAITIRTIVLRGQDAYVQAGAGIVANSDPEREFDETLNKARGLLRAIHVAETQLTPQK